MFKHSQEIQNKMLNEYDKQINKAFDCFLKKELSFNDCVNYLKLINTSWSTCRLDLKNVGNANNSIKFTQKNEDLLITTPLWFKNEKGIGYKLESKKNINIKFKCNSNGKLNLEARSVDLRSIAGIRVPIYINCNSLVIDNQIEIDNDNIICHDKPYVFNKDTYFDKEVLLNLEFKTIFDYYPMLSVYFKNVKNENDLINDFKSLKNYINYEKVLIHVTEINNQFLND